MMNSSQVIENNGNGMTENQGLQAHKQWYSCTVCRQPFSAFDKVSEELIL